MKLHIVNGASLVEGLRAAGITGDIAEYADVLHEGPVPPDHDADAFLEVRAEFIAQCGWAGVAEARAKLDGWRQAAAAFRSYDDVVLWYEHDLFDQLLLIRLLGWWWRHAPVDPPSLVASADYLGPMAVAQLHAYFDARERVTEAQLVLAASAWQAVTAAAPDALVHMVQHENTSALPHLQGALLRLLEEYPSVRNGLGRTEQQVLEILAQSPLTAFDLFLANGRREERVFMGDAVFALRLRRLLEAARPLVARDREDGPIYLTDAGRRVLEGAADDVALNGIDRWIGGVHLTPASYWRWTGAECVRA